MSAIAIFFIVFVIGLIGSIWGYAQPSAKGWWVVYVLMFFVGLIGFFAMIISFLITGG